MGSHLRMSVHPRWSQKLSPLRDNCPVWGLIRETVENPYPAVVPQACMCECAHTRVSLTIPCPTSFSYFACHHLFILLLTVVHEKAFLHTCYYLTILHSFHLDLYTFWEWSACPGNTVITNECHFVSWLDGMTHRAECFQEAFVD